MKVFADFHHPGLYYSLSLVLEKRLGFELYRPVGSDWVDSGYWKLLDLCVTEDQVQEKLDELLIENRIPDYCVESWNRILVDTGTFKKIAPFGLCPTEQRGVTFEQFKKMDFNLLIPTFINNVIPFKELSHLYSNNCPVIAQAGNNWPLSSFGKVPVLASVKPSSLSVDHLFYRQEIDSQIFKDSVWSPNEPVQITSFVAWPDIVPKDRVLINTVAKQLGGSYTFSLFGKHCPNGFVSSMQEVASIMKKSKFGLQLKHVGDGFGQVVYSWFAVGRPVIYRSSYYNNCLASELLEHNVTGIDIDVVEDNLGPVISSISQVDYERMTENVRDRFRSLVNYDNEAFKVASFISRFL